MIRKTTKPPRNLILVLGDQLDGASAAFDGFDADRDEILQMEVREEASYVPQNKRRIAFFFAAMRHFRDAQRKEGRTVHYVELDDPKNTGSFAGEIKRVVGLRRPEGIVVLQPGDFRVQDILEGLDLSIEIREDRHFLCSRDNFKAFLDEHPDGILETFYRRMRKQHDVLMTRSGDPVGGQWNFDHDNRKSFGKRGPPLMPRRLSFKPDAVTKGVLDLVEREFPNSPGSLEGFDLPVTREQALQVVDDFVRHRLPDFGRYQDAMHSGEPFLYHSVISGPMNLHLINPQEVIEAALNNPGKAPLNAVEGFVRQIIGWREYVRGIYWHHMPDYATRNVLRAGLPVPKFYWTGETDMRCLAETTAHTIDHAYAHHIERLMVLGLFNQLLGVRPYDVHRWHMSMFWDSIDWVSLPNTLGMSQFGDGGIMGTKPYVASGAYINRMSDHCDHCRYDPGKSLGEDACPFTTLYWDFLARHRRRFARNARMRNQLTNLRRKDAKEVLAIRRQAAKLKKTLTANIFLDEA